MRSNFPFSAVLWDMDGTLINSEPLWIEQERSLMASLGVKWSNEDAIHCVGGPMTRVDEFMRSKLTDEQRRRFKPLDLTNQLLERMENTLSCNVPFSDGADILLDQMREENIPLALVSASSRPLMNAALRSIGDDYFTVTVSDNDVSRSKPDPEGYCKAADLLGVDITSALVIEDSITGMHAAIASGAFVLGIPHVMNLPVGEKVVHHRTLEGLTLEKLASMFTIINTR